VKKKGLATKECEGHEGVMQGATVGRPSMLDADKQPFYESGI
jgi:hypothetical protein